ncbi:HTTM domain-containing protein [Natribaculum luteum]|uniref:HTTM domain-containing protein n=1 Tax=Natribaculum luteum TaxID=1586232 RepID=A0ABD5NY63_9EURY|nr:HTTM domain-containing protein [Natribaculum luteum]
MDRRTHLTHARNLLVSGLDTLSDGLARRVEVDLRALAAFRIALGTLLLADLARRARHLTAFYTDAGVLPRSALFSDYSDVYSLHAVSGEAWVQVLLFLVAGAFALAMVVGYRTRVATLVSWLLLVSLHVRNPMVLNGGDVLLRVLLFWAIFLPLGERWAIDARRLTRERSTVANVATMAVLLQMVIMYVTNAVHKTSGEMWLNGEAVVYVFSLDKLTFLLGNHLEEYHALLELFTHLWIALLVLSPLLVLLTGVRRAVLASLFVGMHLGMLLTLRIDLFPLVVVAGLVPFYPPVVWDGLSALASRFGLTDALRRRLERLEAVVPDVSTPTLSSRLARGRVLFSTILPYVFLVLVVLSSAQSVGYTQVPDHGETALDATKMEQHWQMFAPEPLQTDGWYVVPARLENGSEVDAYHGSQVDWDRPPSVEKTYPTSRWRKYLSNVWSGDNENHREYFSDYLCDRWNRQHETNVENLTLYYMRQPSEPYNETEPVYDVELHEHECADVETAPDDR